MSTSNARRSNQDSQNNNARTRRLRRGERRRLTREDINSDIRHKEEELANLFETRNALKKRQRDQRAATVAAYKEKDQNQIEVDRSYKDISAKSEEMNRIKAGLIYQQPQRHDDAIRRIEGQLHVNNFKMSDEKRLVQEIDALRRSRRDLTKYQTLRASVDDMRARQRSLKSQRDGLFERIKMSKKEEDELKRKLEALLAEINQVKKTIEELRLRRQQLELGASSSSGDEGERPEASGGGGAVCACGDPPAEAASIEIELDDFDDRTSEAEDHAALCRSLIAYLHNLRPDWAAVAAGDVSAAGDCQARRSSLRKPQRSERALTHPADVFAQFYRLTLRPPVRAAEIPDCLQRLTAILDTHSPNTAPTSPAGQQPAPASASASPAAPAYARSLSNPSNDESGFSETTSVRPESPESAPKSAPVVADIGAAASATDDLLSTSSTICSEDNPPSSTTESPPLPLSAATA